MPPSKAKSKPTRRPILTVAHLRDHPEVFRSRTGLHPGEFATLVDDLRPAIREADRQRLRRPDRKRAIGGGGQFRLALADQVLLPVIWLRQYPTLPVLGYLFGLSETGALRTVHRLAPVLAADARRGFRLPAPGTRSRRGLDALLADTPALALVIDSFEQRVQRPRDRAAADPYSSGKKKQHTLTAQVAVDARDGRIVDVAESVPGRTHDLTRLRDSGLLERLPMGVGAIGDVAYVGMATPAGGEGTATPRKQPRGQPRPPADVASNQAFARRRVMVEHSIGRMRHYQSLSQRDRHHRRHHTERVVAVAGLANRQLAHRFR